MGMGSNENAAQLFRFCSGKGTSHWLARCFTEYQQPCRESTEDNNIGSGIPLRGSDMGSATDCLGSEVLSPNGQSVNQCNVDMII